MSGRGAGLGNAFLSHLRPVDGISEVRAFDDAEVIHVEVDVHPIRDIEIIQTELRRLSNTVGGKRRRKGAKGVDADSIV